MTDTPKTYAFIEQCAREKREIAIWNENGGILTYRLVGHFIQLEAIPLGYPSKAILLGKSTPTGHQLTPYWRIRVDRVLNYLHAMEERRKHAN